MIRLTVMATCLVLTGIAGADTLQVPSDYPTIGDAIAAAQQGDTIAIAAGTYMESDLFIADADITITGDVFPDGSPAVKIDGESTNNILLAIGLAAATGATVENLIFTGSTGNALWIYHHSPTIRNCTFVENASEFQGTAVWSSSTEAVFEDCRFIGNVAGANGNIVHTKGVTGLGSGDNGSPTFRDCLFENNSGSNIVLALFWDARFEECTFQNNEATSLLYVHQGSMTLANTTMCENQGDDIIGDWIDEGGNYFGASCPADCIGDLTGDLVVGVDDLLLLLEAYQVNGNGDCDGDGDTDVDDLLLLIGYYGQFCGFKNVTGCGVMEGTMTEGGCGRIDDDSDPNGFDAIRNLGGFMMGSTDSDECALPRDTEFTTENYVVVGDNLEEVSDDIFQKKGTLEDGRRYAGATKLRILNRGEFVGSEGQKLLYQLTTIKFEIIMRLPEWNPPNNAPPSHVKEWQRFVNAVRIHEMGHVQRYKNVLALVKAKLENQPAGVVSVPNVIHPPFDEHGNHNDETWDKIWTAAEAVILANPSLIEARESQERYDAPRTDANPKGTDHGKLQGATLDKNP